QWKFLIHTILQSLSAKRTSWDEFSTAMASAVICLPKDQKFNFSKVGKGFSGVETPLFEGMLADRQHAEEELVAEQVQVDAADAENVAEDISHGAIPSPPSHDISPPTQEPSSPHQQPHITPPAPTQGEALPTNFQQVLDTCSALIRRVKHLERDNVAQKLEIVKLKARVKKLEQSNKGRMIDDTNNDEGIELVKDAEDDSEVQEVVEVVTTAKIITDVVTAVASQVSAASATIPPAKPSIPAVAPTVVAAYTRRKGVIIRDPEEEVSLKTPAETPGLKDKGKGILVESPKPMKKKDQIELDAEYARKLHEEINKDDAEFNKDIDWDAAIDHTDIKRIDADDQAIQTILLGLPEDVHAAVDSCETAKEIWERNLHEADFTQIYDFLKMNQEEVNELRAKRFAKSHDPLALMAHSQNSFNIPTTLKDQSSSSTHPQQSFPINNKYNPQPPLNQNFMQPPMTFLKDINDPTEAINAALILFAKAFQLSAPTNNNQRTSSNPRNRQIAQPIMNMGVQRGGNQNGLVVVPGIANQSGTGNVVAARAEGDLDEIEEVNANCILMANLQQASTSGTQHDRAPVYDTDGSAEVHLNENCYDNEIFNMFTQEEQYTDLLEPIPEPQLVPQNDNHVTSVVPSMVHSGGTIETSSAPNEKTRVFVPQTTKPKEELFLSNVSNMVTAFKTISIPNEDLSDDTSPSVAQKFLNEVKSSLVTLQCVVKQKMTLEVHNWSSFAHKEVNRIISHEIAPIINQVDAREADESLDKQKSLELEIERLLKASVSHDIMSIVQYSFVDVPSDLRTKLDCTKEKLELCIIKKEKNTLFFGITGIQNVKNANMTRFHMIKLIMTCKKGRTIASSVERSQGHLKTTYKNLFDFIKSNWAHAKLHDLIFENAKLRAQLFKNTSESVKNTSGTSVTPHVDKPKLSAVTPLSKKLHVPMPSHSVPQPREFNVVKHRNVIALEMFKINPSQMPRVDLVPNKQYSASIRTNPITNSQRHVTVKENVSFNMVTASSIGLVHTAKTRRPPPKGNTRNARVPSASKSSKVVQICLWCVDSGCSKHMTENIKLLINFVWKFLGTIRFGNDHIAAILGYGDLKWENITITRVYFVEGLGHNLFSVGQFCDADLEVTFRRNTCFIRDLDGVDLLKGNHSTNLYTIDLYDMASASPMCLMARATPTKSWLWHQRLSHLNFDTINDLAKNDLVSSLPKFKYAKEHLCPFCEQGKSKRASHPPKPVLNLKQRLHLLHMDLCGPMRVASINGKRYVLVIVDDYSRYTWVHFLRTKDETPEVIKNFLKKIYVRLQALVIIVHTDNETEIKNHVLKEYFDSVGITHETSAAKTPQQNGVVERRNRTLVEAARTMLIFSHAPLFLWAEAIATVCYTQNRSIIHRRFNKTPYELIQGRKPDISYLHVFGALCYSKNDHEDISKLGAKGDIGFFIGYSANFVAYRVYNRRTRKIMEMMNVMFDELSAMAFEQNSSRPGLQSMTSGQISSELKLTYAPNLTPSPTASAADNVPNAGFEGELFVNPFGTPSTESVVSSTQYVDHSNMHTFYQPYLHDYQWTKDHPLEQVIGEPSRPVLTRNQLKTDGDMCIYTLTVSFLEPKTVKEALTDPAWIESMQEELHQFIRLDVWELVPSPNGIKPLTLKWLFKNKHDKENTAIRNKTRLVRGYR
nr:retrovirus-related Pol polyprotein from transposon TNT 1-94 [Tanacetum cinerariifolium]